MDLILDTNALSAFAAGEPAVREILLKASRVYLSVIVLGEYRFGLLQSRERSERETWLAKLETIWNVLPVSQATTATYASLRSDLKKKGKPVPSNDLWIAAQAVEIKAPILTRDQHFDLVPQLRIVRW